MAKRLQKTYGRNNNNSDAKRRRYVDLTTDLTDDDVTSFRPNTNTQTMGWVPNTLSTTPLVPKRPTSQAAAMAPSEPSDGDVQTVIETIGCTRAVATRALKVKSNPLAAINAILDNEPLEKQEQDMAWNESHMNDVQPLTGGSAAPTRGNSPVGSIRPNTQIEEDEQMAAAMQASMNGQETGVVNADGTSSTMIGPANEHENGSWAMVRYRAQELLPDVQIADRVQEKDAPEPRFLKHLTDGDYTPNLVTICQAIPMIREAFLMRSLCKDDYGHDDGWWKGQAIPTPSVVHVADGTPVDSLTDKYQELIFEVQRLMAFLTSSDRIYGSTGGLTETKLIKEHNLTGGSLLELFLKSWTAAVDAVDPAVSQLFTTKVGTSNKEGMDTPDMTVAEIIVPKSEDGTTQDLHGILDELFWDADLDEDNYIERPAEVFLVTLKQPEPEKKVNVTVPASIDLGRYLRENLALSRTLRKQIVEARQRIGKIEAIEKKLTTWSYHDPKKAETQDSKGERERKEKFEKEERQNGTKEMTNGSEHVEVREGNAQVGIKDLFTHSIAHFSGDSRKDPEAPNAPPQAITPENSEIAAQLSRIMASIEDKLKILSVHKEKTRTLLSELSKPSLSGVGEEGSTYRYSLRGVATKPDTTYVLTPKASSDFEMSGQDATQAIDAEDTTPAGMQWWRLHYDSNGTSASIDRTKIAEYDVLRAAELEHNSALLVYASDRAVELPAEFTSELPEPLQKFIARDNNQFKLDLAAAKRNPPPYTPMDEDVRNSIERQDRRDSNSSMEVNMGYEPKNFEDPAAVEIHLSPPEDEESGGDVEMVERAGAKPITLGDTAMSGAVESQDAGAQHLENADTKMME